MVLPYSEIMKLERSYTHEWDERDVMLYALSLGMPSDPLDERQLAYVWERHLAVLPVFFATIALNDSPTAHAEAVYEKFLHAGQSVTLHKPLPKSGKAVIKSRMVGVWDKGPEKGSLFRDQSDIYLDGDDEPFASITNTAFARADHGFGAPTEGQPKPHKAPERQPDRTTLFPTTRQQALLYRQGARDPHPLHVDAALARSVGFREPIMHGLCTFGICQRAVLGEHADFRPESIRHIEANFTGSVYPGETIRVDTWQDGDTVSFEAFVVERDLKVIGNGKAVLV